MENQGELLGDAKGGGDSGQYRNDGVDDFFQMFL